jgi:hypothetical protein
VRRPQHARPEPFRPRLDHELATEAGRNKIRSLHHVLPPFWTRSTQAYAVFFERYYPDLCAAGPPTEAELRQIVEDAPQGALWGLLQLAYPWRVAGGLPALSAPPRPAETMVAAPIPAPAPPAETSNVVPFPSRGVAVEDAHPQRDATAEEIDAFLEAAEQERPKEHHQLRRPFLRNRFPAFRDALKTQGVHVTREMVEERWKQRPKGKRRSRGRPKQTN